MNPHILKIFLKEHEGDDLTPDEQRDLDRFRQQNADEYNKMVEGVESGQYGKETTQPRNEEEGGPNPTPAQGGDKSTSEGGEETSSGKAETTKSAPGGYQIGQSPFRQRTPAEVMQRIRSGQAFLNQPANKRINAAAETGRQVNDIRKTREEELKGQGMDSNRAKVVAQMESQNLLRAGQGLPTYTKDDIVEGPDGTLSLSPSSRDQRRFNEEHGAAEYGDKKGRLLGRSIRLPDGSIAFSTTSAGRKHLGTEGRDRFAGIGDGFGGSGENATDRALVEKHSSNGVVDRAGLRSSTPGTAHGQFATESLDRLGKERQTEFIAGMTGRTSTPGASVGVDATGTKRTAADLVALNKKKKTFTRSAATGGRAVPSTNVFSR